MRFNNTLLKSLCFAFGLSVSLSASSRTYLEFLPDHEQWIEHSNYLMKYWLHPDAKGIPEGNFPTWRCDDGSLRNMKLCPGEVASEYTNKMLQISVLDWVRMQSRQTFAYGALFNLTGNKEALRLHKAGVRFLVEKARDPNGGFHNIMREGVPIDWPIEAPVNNSRLSRTPQDLSYALVGLAMNAYLTHDKEIIDVIMDTEKFIFDTYYDEKKGLLKWCFSETYFDKPEQLELVALLDQINAYMLLTWRLVPEASRPEWSAKIKKTVEDINRNFYDPKKGYFYGCIHDKKCFDIYNGRHMDYGHRIKSFWMEYLAAAGLGDQKLKEFAQTGMLRTLNEALASNGRDWFGDRNLHGADFWIYAELDQAALTLALDDKYNMPDTLRPWIKERTDTEYGELKGFGLKAYFWRNGFHSTEHALIGDILSSAIRYRACNDDKCRMNNLTELYFAPIGDISADMDKFTPYLFSGDIKNISNDDDIVKISFENVRIPERVR
ncbi:MAG: hypothetical protein ACI4M9_02120 [Succinivibrio sp.]